MSIKPKVWLTVWMPFTINHFTSRLNASCRVTIVMSVQHGVWVSPGLVVTGRDSCPEGRMFESQHCILDGHFAHVFVVKIVCLKRRKRGREWLSENRQCPLNQELRIFRLKITPR